MALSPQRRLFVEEYLKLKCSSAAEAARRAGYADNGNGAIYSTAIDLLAVPEVKERIEARIAEVAMETDEVLVRVAEHARGDLTNYVDLGPDLELIDGLETDIAALEPLAKNLSLKDEIRSEAQFRLVDLRNQLRQAESVKWRLNLPRAATGGHMPTAKKIKTNRRGETEIELYDGLAALTLLGKHLGLFPDRKELTGANGQAIKTEAMERIDFDSLPPERVRAYREALAGLVVASVGSESGAEISG